MDQDIVYEEQILSVAQNASSCVPTVLISQNILIRSGISHTLSGTRFVISDEALEQISDRSILYLVHDDLAPDKLNETVVSLKAQRPSARVVLLTTHMEPAAVVQVLLTGLDGLCSTETKREPLIKALELVMLGETFISPVLSFSLLSEASRHQRTIPNGAALFMSGTAPASMTSNNLSAREAQILHCLTQGASNKHIARDLGVGESVVKLHLKAIMRKLRASNRTQAAMWAQHHLNTTFDRGSVSHSRAQ